MRIRRLIFWSHLAAGVLAGLFILTMAVTGILLTYEHRIELAITDSITIEAPDGQAPLTVDELASMETIGKAGSSVSLSFDNRQNAPVIVSAGRNNSFLVDPFTGEKIDDPSEPWGGFFQQIESIHRWLGVEGENRAMARNVVNTANLAFVFLIISGLYLWLPKAYKWVFFKLNLFFRKSYPTAKARDYNWHHVFGIWALIPLFLISTTGAVFHYKWANNLVYAAFGESAPQRGGPPSAGGATPAETEPTANIELASLSEAFERAKSTGKKDWTRIAITLPQNPMEQTLKIDRSHGDRIIPRQRETLTFDRTKSEVIAVSGVEDLSAGRRARTFIRFLHTGEVFGFLGATIAGLASIAACFLVWTGFALAWRRLVQPAFRKKSS